MLFSRPSADFAALGQHPASSGRLPRAALPRSNGLRPALTNELNAGTSRRDGDSLTQLKVQSKIESFPSSLLTRRERQVLFYGISGYSSALTVQRQSATEGTIKIRRKNTYRKLDIGSQAELFSLFINYMPFAMPKASVDPLEIFRSAPASVRSQSLLDVAQLRS